MPVVRSYTDISRLHLRIRIEGVRNNPHSSCLEITDPV